MTLGGVPTDNNGQKGLSALEKAKLLKAKVEETNQEKAKLSKAEEEKRQQELDEKYIVDKTVLAKMKADKEEMDKGVKNARDIRRDNILGQRAATKEMLANNSNEEIEFFKENKKDIFTEDDAKLSSVKSTEKELKGKSKNLDMEINSREEGLRNISKKKEEIKSQNEEIEFMEEQLNIFETIRKSPDFNPLLESAKKIEAFNKAHEEQTNNSWSRFDAEDSKKEVNNFNLLLRKILGNKSSRIRSHSSVLTIDKVIDNLKSKLNNK